MQASGQGGGVTGGAVAAGAARAFGPAEFATQFSRASRVLWCIAAAVLGDRHGAEDVVQDAAVTAMGKLHEFTPGTSFEHWMGQIVRFTALNEARKGQRRRAVLKAGDAMEGAPGLADAAPGDDEFDDRTLAALRTLDPTARECLLLRTVMDLPYAQIARMLGIPEGTAMSHVHRSRQSMRRALGGPESPRGGVA